ncbi:MAG: TetR/AcrR family transcriptional regulator [Eubacteriaceae bacterium]
MKTDNIRIDNRDKIIDISTKLFYEYGYNKTSFQTIANYCGITKGLITYHFGSKANLAKEIVQKYNIEFKNSIDTKIYCTFKDYNLSYSVVAQIFILHQMYKDDEKALRFYLEYLDSGFKNQFADGIVYFYKIFDRHYHLDINEDSDEITMLSTAAAFSALSLFYSFFTGKLKCSFEEYSEYAVRIQFKLMNIEDNKVDHIIIEGKKIMNQLDYKICPYFKVF